MVKEPVNQSSAASNHMPAKVRHRPLLTQLEWFLQTSLLVKDALAPRDRGVPYSYLPLQSSF